MPYVRFIPCAFGLTHETTQHSALRVVLTLYEGKVIATFFTRPIVHAELIDLL